MGVIIDLEEEKILRSYDMIGNTIVDYIRDMDLCWEIEMARKIYFGKYLDLMGRKKPALTYKPFIQWLIFSYKLPNNQSLIECIYSRYKEKMSNYERDTLTKLKNTYEGFYKVYRVEGDRILAKDIFTKENVYICDNLLVHNVKRYWGIFTRIVPVNNKNIPVPGYSIMTNSFLKDMEHYIIKKHGEYNKYDFPISIQSFIDSHSLMIHRYFLRFSI